MKWSGLSRFFPNDILKESAVGGNMSSKAITIPILFHRLIISRIGLLNAAAWVATHYVLEQVLRLGTSVALAWLLAPHLLGTMLLINTLRTGGELLSDVGIGQGIVRNGKGAEPRYLNTAWTIQIGRGFLLYSATLAATIPLANVYGNPELKSLLPIAGLVFVISGFASPARFLLQKRMQLRKLSLFGMGTALASSAVNVGLAFYSPTIWALVAGLLISTAISTLGSYFLINWRMQVLSFDREAAREIVGFGKWIFLSSLVYFAAMNFDRLYLAGAVPLAVLGVYGVARTITDSITRLFQRLSSMIIFPKISGLQLDAAATRNLLLPIRRLTVCIIAMALACAVVLADRFVALTYDDRYQAAQIYLPILLVGTWFSVLAAIGDAVMMGIGKPSSGAIANAAKFLFILAVVPQQLPLIGMIGAVALFALAEVVRYGVLTWRKRAHGLSFLGQDAFATLLFFSSIVALRQIASALHITPGFSPWVDSVRLALG
ncbi:oligosaccharide flippase family protein [Altererythrobacter salegens]|uniref:Oligosaccharide flippase family protein n=1 Tax=Croceibacterium salegens TaxID=1737568 RepID=A0A6I4SZ46_9SPHN|nr:oligosaccharide flippase family protein [Croceibacterium salegens]MXO60718.1 oligosaccharide flippase family protein [Croceibacterium salegens]